MNCFITRFSLLLFFFPIASLAGWQVAQPQTATPPSNTAFFQAGYQKNSALAPAYNSASLPAGHFANLSTPVSVYAISVSGSIKENIERIMDRYHWKVIWQAPYDYNFDGRVSGSSLPNVMEKLLNPFPLQGTLYMSNRTMKVTARKV